MSTNNKYKRSDLSETSMDQDSEASLIIIPDSEDSRNTLYSTIVDEIDSNSEGVLGYTQILPDKRNCKSTETSFIEDNITEDYSNYSNTLSKTLSDNIFYSNEVIEPYPQTFSVRPANLGDQLLTRNINENVLEGEGSSNLLIDLIEDSNARTIIPYLCGNSKENVNNPSQNYQSSCKSKQEESNQCTDKTKTDVCEDKAKAPKPKACKINTNNSNISLETKRICASMAANASGKQDAGNIRTSTAVCNTSQETKKLCETITKSAQKETAAEEFSCDHGNNPAKCCASVLKAPKCDPESLKAPPKKEKEVSCCSVAATAKKSLSDFKKCPFSEAVPEAETEPPKPQASDTELNGCTPSSCMANKEASLSSEKVMSCTSNEEKTQECKNKPSYCSNTMLSDSVGKRFSILNLDKCPSKINIENMQYIQAESQHRPTSDSTGNETLSGANLLTESQRNINAYYGFNSKPRNMPNCMKVKVIPSTTNLTRSELSVIKMKVDRNETIPTCKITSDDFTSMAKGFFGCIYAKTKDATTYITRESARLLDSVNHRSRSCNTDDTLMPAKVFKDKAVETPLSYLKRKKSLPFALVDQGTSKNEKSKHGKLFGNGSPSGSYSAVNLCSCSKKYKSAEFSNIAVQEPPQQSNSVFTAIKSKIFSIFREDDAATGSYKSKTSKSSTLSEDLDDSDDSETGERMLPKRN